MLRRVMACSLIIVLATGCGASGADEPTGESSRFILSQDYELPVVEREAPRLPASVTDASGTTVTVTDASRIVVLNEAIAEIVVSLGLRDNIIGRDATTTLEALQAVDEVSNGHDVSAESVLSLRPTVVIGDTRTGPPEALQQLRGAGVPVVIAPEVWTLSDLPGRVTMLAVVLGVPRAGERLIALSQAAIDDALTNVGKASAILRVAFLYVRGTASVYLLGGSGSGADEIVAAAGGVDVGALNGLAAFTPLTAEAIVQADPDVLLVMTRGLESVGGIDGLLALPGVSSTRAAASRAVIAVDDDLLLSFGPRTGALIERLAEILRTFSSDA
jgi:iron complex transport system substrate-binding protein